MPPSSHALNALLRTLLRQEGQEQDDYRNRSYSRIETINYDVFQLIALELHRTPRQLKPLASCSRTLRTLASPVLFSRCHHGRSNLGLFPPETICSFVRHWTYSSVYVARMGNAWKFCQKLLDCLPSLTAITFHDITLSWAVIRVCLSSPRITSITFSPSADLRNTDPPPLEEVPNISTALSKLSYDDDPWPSMRHGPGRLRIINPPDPRMLAARESQCLVALVSHVNATLTQLSLPMMSAPLLKMTELPWPRLRELSIYGSCWTSERIDTLPVLLGALPRLEKLSIRVALIEVTVRPPRVMGQHSTPRLVLPRMRSLTVAYPDPDDRIFMIDTSHLSHLSICDWPRHYNSLVYEDRHRAHYAYPILSSTECLSILRRMDLPELSSLELVYLADRAGADDDLLRYVASKFPKLAHLELHRYRADRKEEVDHAHIARLLTAAQSLRNVRLNLDFLGDHGPYCGAYIARKVWWDTFKGTLGWEIIDIMQDCPLLCCVELLYHGSPTATWVEFHARRCAEPRFVLSYDSDHREPELMPVNWFNVSGFGPWSGHPEQDMAAVQAWQAAQLRYFEESSDSDSSGSEDGTPTS